MNKDRNRGRYIAAALGGLFGFLGYGLLDRFGYLSVQGNDNSSSTKFPTAEITPSPTFTPTTTSTETATRTSTSTSTPEPSSTPTPTPTPESAEGILVEGFSPGGEGTVSEYPAFLNALGDERSGVNLASVDRFKDYWLQRALRVASGNKEIQRLDRMFGQLSLPVKDITDRRLNFDWRNEGQGLGFDVADLAVLRTFEEMKQVQESSGNDVFSPISRKGGDEHYRALTIVDARNFEKVVLAYVDEFLRINGIQNPAVNPLIQDERRALFERIIYGDLGVSETDRDGLWQTVNDKFKVCETFTANAETRSDQPENTRRVGFNPDQEVANNGIEEETISNHDSDNDVLVIMVATPNGGYLRVELYDLSNPPDLLNPELNPSLAETDPVRVFGGRLLPCGPGESAPDQEDTPVPTRTTVPSVTPARTQPPQPTRTPGGTGATPRVPTPRPTPKDTEEVQPNPPPVEPINTPSF
jgi:hypothetical protein